MSLGRTPAHRQYSYNGTSELQLERMNVYFNEVGCPDYILHLALSAAEHRG